MVKLYFAEISEMSIPERIKEIAKDLNTKPYKLSLMLGFSRSLLPGIILGDKSFTLNVAERIRDMYGYNLQWLLYGTGEKLASSGESNIHEVDEDQEVTVSLPYAPVPVRGSFVEMPDPEKNYGNLSRINVRVKKGEDTRSQIVFEVNGDSMEPQLASGTKVRCRLIDPANWEYLSSGIYAVSYANSFVIKRIKDNELISKGYLTLHSDNILTGGSVIVPINQIHHIWKAIRIVDAPIF